MVSSSDIYNHEIQTFKKILSKLNTFFNFGFMIAIVDYKMGNLGSISNIIKKIGHQSIITSDPSVIANASKIILPGVGHF